MVAGLTQVRFAAGSPDGVDMQSTDIAISLSLSVSLSLFFGVNIKRGMEVVYEERERERQRRVGKERIWQLDVTGLVEHLPILVVWGMREHPHSPHALQPPN